MKHKLAEYIQNFLPRHVLIQRKVQPLGICDGREIWSRRFTLMSLNSHISTRVECKLLTERKELEPRSLSDALFIAVPILEPKEPPRALGISRTLITRGPASEQLRPQRGFRG